MFQSRSLPLVLSAIALAVLTTACGKSEPVATTAPPPPAPATTTVGTELDDSVMTTAVKAALLTEASLNSMDVMVETRKGEVQLSGFINSKEDMNKAVELTRSVKGVESVKNDMRMK